MRTHEGQESLFVRDKSEQNISSFLEELDCIDWSNLDGYNDPKICYSNFLERYTKTYEKHFPLKKLTGGSFRCRLRLAFHDFIFCLSKLQMLTRASLLALAKSI